MGFFKRDRQPKTGEENIRDFFIYWCEWHGNDRRHPDDVEEERLRHIEGSINYEYECISHYKGIQNYVNARFSKYLCRKIKVETDKSIAIREDNIKKLEASKRR